MHSYINIYIYQYIYIFTHTYSTGIYIYTHTYSSYINIYIYTHSYIDVRIHLCICIGKHAFIYQYIYIYIHSHTHTYSTSTVCQKDDFREFRTVMQMCLYITYWYNIYWYINTYIQRHIHIYIYICIYIRAWWLSRISAKYAGCRIYVYIYVYTLTSIFYSKTTDVWTYMLHSKSYILKKTACVKKRVKTQFENFYWLFDTVFLRDCIKKSVEILKFWKSSFWLQNVFL